LRLARRWLPYPAKGHTPDEEPLRPAHIRQLTAVFGRVEVQGVQLLAMLRRLLPRHALAEALCRGDDRLLDCWPDLRRYCRYVVLTLRR
jgi:hypothetical protein